MTMNQALNDTTLDTWLKAVSNHIAVRRMHTNTTPRPHRNRDRERARREARQLFAEYYRERALEWAA